MRLVAPPDWGAAVDYRKWTPDPLPRERIALHYNGPALSNYDAGPARERQILQAIERFHRTQRGWGGIGYSHAIGASGTVYLARGDAQLAAHAGDFDGDGIVENLETYGVLLILGAGQKITPAMEEGIVGLRGKLESFEGRELPLIGHREIAEQGSGTSTACPGDLVMAYVKAHRRLRAPLPGEPILGAAQTLVSDSTAWARSRGAHERFVAVIPIYYDLAPALGVRPEVGIVQASHETRDGHFGRAVTPAHHNWAGIKVTNPTGADDDPDSHARFPNDETGVLAHLEHLRLYASGPVANPVDPRHFPWIAGSAPTVAALGGKWAPAVDYGTKLEARLERLLESAPDGPDGLDPWARDAWAWALENGVASSSSRPDAPVTDERLFVFLKRLEEGRTP